MQADYPSDIQAYLIAVDNTRIEIQMSPEAVAAAEKVAGFISELVMNDE